MGSQIEELGLELENLKEKVSDIKEVVDNLTQLWDSGNLYPEAEKIIFELREIVDSVEI